LKHANNKISRIYYPGNDVILSEYTGSDFYRDMVEHSKNDSVYDLLHGRIDVDQLDEAVSSRRFLINKNNLPSGYSFEELLDELDEGITELDTELEDQGFVNVNIEKLARMPDQISDFVEISDRTGTTFIEVILS